MRWIMKDGGLNVALVDGAAKLMHTKLMDKNNKLDFMLEHIAEKFFIFAAKNGSSFDFYAFHQHEWELLPTHLIGIFLTLKPLGVSLDAPPKKKRNSDMDFRK